MSATKKRLPHGTIPFERITDRTVRDIVMKLNENIVSLKRQVGELQAKIDRR